ncbi:hypothetical protein E6W36_04905 [Hankyongella ginsenosidimutans]|uniref:V-type ATP synthase subunit E n=1 Tax=Hankyongella ginsenosidimutans TaxID=1763828 RepID=A0A4D7CB81_9SPHN|nr:hypothetical protein [Hankyongella ginsenosidimutans]QCI79136.1 hypothetical protein E6W36_04905 [Hankyongella ginsenosidimutans]TXG83832.1 MAG: hypothetical protein E6R12_06760 [Sphingomonadales bacterium]
MTGSQPLSAGVDELIRRLHQDGVDAGRAEAERLLEDARRQAAALVAGAQAERDAVIASAQAQAEELQRAAAAALRLAARDTLLKTREAVRTMLEERLARHVGQALLDPVLVADLARLAAMALTGSAATIEAGIQGDALVAGLVNELASQGVTLIPIAGAAGVTLYRDGGAVSVELSDATIAAWLARQISPRFRALLDSAAVPPATGETGA